MSNEKTLFDFFQVRSLDELEALKAVIDARDGDPGRLFARAASGAILTDEEKAEFRAQSNRTRPNHRSRKLGDAILRDNYAMMVLINEMILAKKGRPERGRRTAAINYVLGRINEAVDFSTLSKWTKEFESDDEKLEAAHNFFKDRFGGK